MFIKALLMMLNLNRSVIKLENLEPIKKVNGLLVSGLENKSGFDQRHPNTTDTEELFRVYKNMELKKVLNQLEDENLSLISKMNILDKYSFLFEESMDANITSGGLLDDFYFEFG